MEGEASPPQPQSGSPQPPSSEGEASPSQPQAGPQQPSSGNCTLWVGDLESHMDEHFLEGYFQYNQDFVSAKVVKDIWTEESKGYGFVVFTSHEAAEKVLQTRKAVSQLPRTQSCFSMNWSFAADRELGRTYDIFVGNLAREVTTDILKQTFSAKYGSVRGAEVVIDRFTCFSRGYGFVRFGDESDQILAMKEMNGVDCLGKKMCVRPAKSKKDGRALQFGWRDQIYDPYYSSGM